MTRRNRETSFWIPAFAGMTARIVAALALLWALTAPALAREEIQSFDSRITLETNGSIDVVETIIVNSEDIEIHHGIYRDFFTELINEDNSRLRSDFNVIDVTRDGQSEKYHIDSLAPGKIRVYFGDADVYIDRGVHTYVFHYTMSRAARYFADYDEFYWNTTGNYWVFPIVKATATVDLPPGIEVQGIKVYTGFPGSKDADATFKQTSPTSVTFATNNELETLGDQSQGLTVDLKLGKGVLVAPEGLTAFGNWLSDHRTVVFPAIAVAIVLLYNFLAWNAVGRDPQKGPIIPLFHPPKDMSPAQVHYVNRMGFKQSGWTAFTASIFDLGVKGLVKIDKAGGTTNITSTGDAAAALPTGEQEAYDLIHSKGTITIDKTDGPKLNAKRGQMVTSLTKESGETYFKNNGLYTFGGVVLAAAMLGALVWLDVLEPVYLIFAVIGAIVIGVFLGIMTSRGGAGGIVGKLFGLVWLFILGANFLGSGVSALAGLRFDTGLVAALSIVVIVIVFGFLMRAPTVAGRKLMDQIDGFKMYLETAEKNRLNYVDKGEPQMTIKRFEAILPFAIALGVEKLWSQRFEADLARNAVADAVDGSYSPLWYSGSDWSSSSSGFSNTVSSVASSMSAAMIAAQPSSSSSSGFSSGGGGGSSGGGGGGGGGGGW